MAGDWIKLHRKLLDSAVGSDPWLCFLWVQLLLRASWKPSWFLGDKIGAGQVAISQVNFATQMGVSRGKIQRGLKALRDAKQITLEARRRYTLVTICKWSTYQQPDEPPRAPNDTPDDTPDGTPSGTSNGTHSKKVRNKEGKKRDRHFVPPTLEDVAAYCEERKNNISPQRFLDYYETNGWVQSRGKPVKDWKACVRTWENNERDRQKQETGTYAPTESIF